MTEKELEKAYREACQARDRAHDILRREVTRHRKEQSRAHYLDMCRRVTDAYQAWSSVRPTPWR
jgi:hypothetical protein